MARQSYLLAVDQTIVGLIVVVVVVIAALDHELGVTHVFGSSSVITWSSLLLTFYMKSVESD